MLPAADKLTVATKIADAIGPISTAIELRETPSPSVQHEQNVGWPSLMDDK